MPCRVLLQGNGKAAGIPMGEGPEDGTAVAYYDDEKFKDWVHADTGAPMLKAQHPAFETWSQGIHARSDVTCSDCHMPYKREGALKQIHPRRQDAGCATAWRRQEIRARQLVASRTRLVGEVCLRLPPAPGCVAPPPSSADAWRSAAAPASTPTQQRPRRSRYRTGRSPGAGARS